MNHDVFSGSGILGDHNLGALDEQIDETHADDFVTAPGDHRSPVHPFRIHPIGAGVRMGAGVGGRVPRFPSNPRLQPEPCFPDLDGELGCGVLPGDDGIGEDVRDVLRDVAVPRVRAHAAMRRPVRRSLKERLMAKVVDLLIPIAEEQVANLYEMRADLNADPGCPGCPGCEDPFIADVFRDIPTHPVGVPIQRSPFMRRWGFEPDEMPSAWNFDQFYLGIFR